MDNVHPLPKPGRKGQGTAARPRSSQVVLVLQGGGALGAYQAGVYEAMHAAGIEPDWVIGISIGAINAGLIAGNAPEARLERLREFWRRIAQQPHLDFMSGMPWLGRILPNWNTITNGVDGFFKPNPLAFLGMNTRLAPDAAGYYSTRPLEQTLTDLVDLECMATHGVRLTVGAANVRTAQMRYFDSRDTALTLRHIMASGALPPAFPAVRIDDELYWDGGILSNTPVEAVFDDNPRRNSLIFAVHVWNPQGDEPESIWQVMNRQKDIQYSSRAVSHIARQKQIHTLRHIIADLTRRLPESERQSEAVRELSSYGCLTQMHVMRLLAPQLDNEDHTKDIDFSPGSIKERWEAGYAATMRMIEQSPWETEVDPIEGFYLHEPARPTNDSTSA